MRPSNQNLTSEKPPYAIGLALIRIAPLPPHARKMVNVNTQIPFNLHGQNLATPLDPSSSRSHSVGGANNNNNTNPANYSRENSRRPSPSPAPSLQMSGSSTSLHPGDVASSLDHEPRKPLLNVRLVRGVVGPRRTSGSRVRGRLARTGEEGGGRDRDASVADSGAGPSLPERSPENDRAQDVDDDGQELLTPRPPGHTPQWVTIQSISVSCVPEFNPPRPSFQNGLTHNRSLCPFQDPSADALPSSNTPEFKFQDVGVISRSWGD